MSQKTNDIIAVISAPANRSVEVVPAVSRNTPYVTNAGANYSPFVGATVWAQKDCAGKMLSKEALGQLIRARVCGCGHDVFVNKASEGRTDLACPNCGEALMPKIIPSRLPKRMRVNSNDDTTLDAPDFVEDEESEVTLLDDDDLDEFTGGGEAAEDTGEDEYDGDGDEDDLAELSDWGEDPEDPPVETHAGAGMQEFDFSNTDDTLFEEGEVSQDEASVFDDDDDEDTLLDPEEDPEDYDMLEASTDAVAEGSFEVIASGDSENPVSYLMVDKTPVAVIDSSKASAEVRQIFGTEKLRTGIKAAAAAGFNKEDMTAYGIRPITYRVDASSAVAQARRTAKAQHDKVHAERLNSFSEKIIRCVHTAMSGVQKGFFPECVNPVKLELFERMAAAGVRHPERIIDAAFDNSGQEYLKVVAAKAQELMDLSPDALSTTIKHVASAKYVPVTDTDDTGEYSNAFSERLANSSVAAGLVSTASSSSSSSTGQKKPFKEILSAALRQ